jgi:hypothetical protein
MILVSDIKRFNMTEANCLFCMERCSQQPVATIFYEPVESSQHVLNICVSHSLPNYTPKSPCGPSFSGYTHPPCSSVGSHVLIPRNLSVLSSTKII